MNTKTQIRISLSDKIFVEKTLKIKEEFGRVTIYLIARRLGITLEKAHEIMEYID